MSDTSMSDATSQGSSQGSSATGDLKQAAGQTFQEVKSRTMDAMPRIAESVRGQAMEQAETAKDALASTAERLAQSLRESNSGDDSIQARLMLTASDAVLGFSDQIRGRSFDQLWNEVQGFARRNPGAFVAAAAVTGFALARFARASSRGTQDDRHGSYGSYGAMGGSGMSGSSGYGSASMGSGMTGSSTGSGMGSSTGSSGMGSAGSMGGSSGSGMGSGGSYAGTGSLGVGTGTGYGSGMGGAASTTGTGATGDVPGSIADDGMGGGSASGDTGSGTPNSTSGKSGSGYDR